MKIKLKNLTNEQFEKWRKKLCVDRELYCENCPIDKALCHCNLSNCWICNEDIFSEKFLNQEIEVEDEPILTEKEKVYLEAVLNPFKNREIKIIKKLSPFTIKECIMIWVEKECIDLPYFEANKMYKGMKIGTEYTPEELGLFEDE